MQRIVQPEILDSLPSSDPRAQASRRDLILYNRLMGNYRWFTEVLAGFDEAVSILEIGAGDGSLALSLQASGSAHSIGSYTGLDLLPQPQKWPVSWDWIQTDILDYPFNGNHKVLFGNLILHHFEADDLRKLGRRIVNSKFEILVMNEPARRRPHLWQVSLSRLLGIHSVTFHDARVSIKAGFRKDQLAALLGLEQTDWKVEFRETFGGANRLICRRRL